jgi:hypothetical protein
MGKTKGNINLPKPLDIGRLRTNLQAILREIDRMGTRLDDSYSPVTWTRFQHQSQNIADAIDSVRLRLSGVKAAVVAQMVGNDVHQVAGYHAWNTMFNPNWVAPSTIVKTIACKCGATVGMYCGVVYGNKRICKSRRDAYLTRRFTVHRQRLGDEAGLWMVYDREAKEVDASGLASQDTAIELAAIESAGVSNGR